MANAAVCPVDRRALAALHRPEPTPDLPQACRGFDRQPLIALRTARTHVEEAAR